MRSYLSYLGIRFSTAGEGFGDFAKEHFKWTIVTLVGSYVSVIWLGFKGEALTDHIMELIGTGVVGPLAVTGLSFLVFWFIAPYRVWRDQHSQIDTLQKNLRRRAHRDNVEDKPLFDWRTVSDAFDEFCQPAVVARQKRLTETYEKASLRRIEYDEQMNELLPGLPANEENYNRLRGQREGFGSAAQMAEYGLTIVWNELSIDMEQQLLSGKIVAQGFREPHTGGNTEVLILASEWRILELVPRDSTAINKRDSSVIYSCIQLARAPTAGAP